MLKMLTCYTGQCPVSICDQRAHATFQRRHTPLGPTLACSRTNSETNSRLETSKQAWRLNRYSRAKFSMEKSPKGR